MFNKIFLLFFLALFIAFGNPKAENLSEAPNEATEFTTIFNPQKFPKSAAFYNKNGTEILLSKYAGKVIVLNFYKPTCIKCLIEMPSLNALAQKYPQIAVIAVSEGDEDAAFIERILHQERRLTNIAVSMDKKGRLFKLMDGDKVPQTRLIDKNGVVVGTIKGQADFNSPHIYNQIDALLK